MPADIPVEIQSYRGEQIREFAPLINEWIIEFGQRFPFLYIAQEEIPPGHVLAEDPNAFVLLGIKNEKTVAILAAHPLISSCLNVKYSPLKQLEEMQEKGFDLDSILYLPFFLVADEERHNNSLINRLYQEATTLAHKMGMKQACYFTTIREENHPLRPNPYIPVEPWDDLLQPFRNTGITFDLVWPTLQANGSVENAVNYQAIYIQDLVSSSPQN